MSCIALVQRGDLHRSTARQLDTGPLADNKWPGEVDIATDTCKVVEQRVFETVAQSTLRLLPCHASKNTQWGNDTLMKEKRK